VDDECWPIDAQTVRKGIHGANGSDGTFVLKQQQQQSDALACLNATQALFIDSPFKRRGSQKCHACPALQQ
jgi:hypothetical protein